MKQLPIWILFALLFGCHDQKSPMVFQGETMGTTYKISVGAELNPAASQKIQEEIGKLLSDINGKMSTYLPNSEISLFNKFEKTEWFPVSPETLHVVSHAQEVSKITSGAFDITVGPLVNLWGFGPNKLWKKPSSEIIAATQKKVGYQNLLIDPQGNLLKKQNKDLYIDLSAIAKGYAVDMVADHLESQKITSYLVEIGGELRAHGIKRDGSAWKIGIEDPSLEQRRIHRIIEVMDMAVATSGNYRNFHQDEQGNFFSHTIDPRTGSPVKHNLASITVVDASCMRADALATAFMVLSEEGYQLAEKMNIPCYFIWKTPEGLKTKATTAFTKLFEKQK